MKEEDLYLKALGILDDALDGKIIDANALRTAESMFLTLATAIYQERLKRQTCFPDVLLNEPKKR